MTARQLARYGLRLQVPAGWDARLMRHEPVARESVHPVLHAGNFRLPASAKADYGSDIVGRMRDQHVLVVLKEFAPSLSRTALYDHPVPWPLTAASVNPAGLQRTIRGQAGCQRFFNSRGRAFCLYVVLGSYADRHRTIPLVNEMLADLHIEADAETPHPAAR